MKGPIPLLVLGGFLGAGKTTLLNRLLAEADGERLAVLVNDFGAVAVDSRLIAGRDGETIALSNGCICCSIGSSLMETLLRLLARPDPPDRLVIEASGVADPARIAAIGLAGDAFRLEGIVTVVDAEQARVRAADLLIRDTVLAQIAAADLLILSKADLVDAPALAAMHQWLAGLTGAPVVTAVQGAVPPALLSGIHAGSGLVRAAPADHAAAFGNWTLVPDQPFLRDRLTVVLDSLGAEIWRAKGFLSLEGEGPFLLQQVGRRWSLTPADGPPGIVLIGPQALDGQRLLDTLGSAQR